MMSIFFLIFHIFLTSSFICQFIIFQQLAKMEQEGSKSQIALPMQPSPIRNGQEDHSEAIIDFQVSKHPIKMQVSHEVRSEAVKKSKRSIDDGRYKKDLLALMVISKLQSFGYRQAQVKTIVYKIIARFDQIEEAQGKELSVIASDLANMAVVEIIGDIELPRLRSHLALLQFRQRFNRERVQQNQRQIVHEAAAAHVQQQLVHENPIILPQIVCNICYMTSVNYFDERCGHYFCYQCMQGYVKQNLTSYNFIIKCPQYECTEQLDINIIKKALSAKQYERFVYFKQKNERQNNPDNKFCSKPDCGELLQEQDDLLKCPKCQSIYCQICQQPYHNDNPCDIVLRNAIQSTYNSFKIKKCPNCKSPIQKSQGCNHMTCKKCKHQFCWICLKKYSVHHYRYYNCFGCPGMQFEEEDQAWIERLKQILLFVSTPFILLIVFGCFLSAIPLYIIGNFLYKPCYWASNYPDLQFVQSKIVSFICCDANGTIPRILLWILYQPRSAIYAAVIAPIKITALFCGQICKVFE